MMISQPQMTLTQLLFGADISSTRRRSLAHLSVHGRVVHHFFMVRSRKLKHGFDTISAIYCTSDGHERSMLIYGMLLVEPVPRVCFSLFSYLPSSLQPPYKISQVVVLIIIIYYSNNILIIIYGSIYIAQNHAHLGPCTN